MIGILFILAGIGVAILQSYAQPAPGSLSTSPSSSTSFEQSTSQSPESSPSAAPASPSQKALDVLATLEVKGRAPKTNYARAQFGDGWALVGNCDTRNIVLNRDLTNAVVNEKCKVVSGTLTDPYTGQIIQFQRGDTTSALIQIDHVVALSNAWQTGAQSLSVTERASLANDPLELLAVDGNANQAKGDGDAATWLPANKPFRCQYVARQIAVKAKYRLWVTEPEKSAMSTVLEACPDQLVPPLKS